MLDAILKRLGLSDLAKLAKHIKVETDEETGETKITIEMKKVEIIIRTDEDG